MGQVWQATDTQLNRQVALKILPDAFADDPDRLARFKREAQILASLNHPNIAAIYGIEEAEGTRALVLELVDGPTLADRITKGPIPLDEALPIAKQIAEALEAAHEAGVIHRDLKPANIKVREDGTVKVLDFGLAKALDPSPASDPSESPTLTAAATQMGVILGTAAYMSPEQARGSGADRRADIWAFGVVLYEMVTGRRLFEGATVSDTLASVLKTEPDWSALSSDTPPAMKRLLRRCLEKDRKERLQHVGDARVEIREALTAPSADTVTAGPVAPPSWRRALPLGIAALIVVGVVTGLVVRLLVAPDPQSVSRFAIGLSGDQYDRFSPSVALSPDGRTLVYVALSDGVQQLYERPMDQLDAVPIRGTEGASSPFFSPDGEWVGFFAGGALKTVSLAGGPPVLLCGAPAGGGGSWTGDDTIVFGSRGSGLSRVPAAGGSPEPLTMLGPDDGGHRWPHVLPGGRAVLFSIASNSTATPRLAVQDLESGERRILGDGVSPRFSPTGHLVFMRDDTLWAVRFDTHRLDVVGEPVPLLEDVQLRVRGAAEFTFADDGTLVYVPHSAVAERRLVWVDRDGQSIPLTDERRSYVWPRLSPDGTQVAVVIEEGGDQGIWIYDRQRRTRTRLSTTEGGSIPLWTRDGTRVAFSRSRGVYSTPADGSGEAEALFTRDFPVGLTSWSPDGRTLAFVENHPATGADIWVWPGEGDPVPVMTSASNEGSARFSPGGRWLAYNSDETGRGEVYVQAYPGPGRRVPISTDGGTEPMWSADGRELFYRNGDRMMVVVVETQPGFKADIPRVLFEGRYSFYGVFQTYGVSPDGQGFLMMQDADHSRLSLNIVQNWFEELKRLVPVN